MRKHRLRSAVYLGGFVGGGWSHDDASEPDLGIVGVVLGAPPVQTTSRSSFIGGIEGGDRYQFGKLVIGWEEHPHHLTAVLIMLENFLTDELALAVAVGGEPNPLCGA